MSPTTESSTRHLLVIAHTGRADSLEAGIQVCRQLIEAGLTPVVSPDEHAHLIAAAPDLTMLSVLGDDVAATSSNSSSFSAATARSCGPPRSRAAVTPRSSV